MRSATRWKLIPGTVMAMVLCGSALAQGGTPANAQSAGAVSEDVRFFRLDFVVKELDAGKVVNSRAYSTVTSTGHGMDGASIRAGSRVPIFVGAPAVPAPGGDQNVQYIDVGVNIDCNRVHMKGEDLVTSINAEVSTLAEDFFYVQSKLPMPPGKEQPMKGGPGPGFAGMPEGPHTDFPPGTEMAPPMPPRTMRNQFFVGTSTRPSTPVIRQNKWWSIAFVPLGKPVTLFYSDDTTSKRRTEVELTATEVH